LTQGGNTVININIDSNAFQQPQPVLQDQYQTQPTRESNHFVHQNQLNPQTNLQTNQNSLTRANQNPQISYLTAQNQRGGLDHGSNQASRTFQPAKRQNSSKMRQESVSSNKSRRNNRQGSHNHRRSSSSSHMQQQMFQIQQLHNMSQNQHQIYTQNQQTPQSNTQIIFQNIAKINEKLIQQQMQQTSGQINTNDQIQNK